MVTAFPALSEADLIRNIKPGAVVIDCSTDGNLHPDVAERASYLSTTTIIWDKSPLRWRFTTPRCARSGSVD